MRRLPTVAILSDAWLVDRASGGCLPALLFGWDAIAPNYPSPSFVLEVGHQYGGLACSQRVLSGLVLPLHDNRDRATHDPSPLLEALRCIAESQQEAASGRTPRSAIPLVDAWGYTHGGLMTARALRDWDALLARYFELPALEAGAEALLTFARSGGESLLGWCALNAAHESARATTVIDETTLGGLTRARPSDRAATPPRLHLLWENSD